MVGRDDCGDLGFHVPSSLLIRMHMIALARAFFLLCHVIIICIVGTLVLRALSNEYSVCQTEFCSPIHDVTRPSQ